jgi:hypothetical protein
MRSTEQTDLKQILVNGAGPGVPLIRPPSSTLNRPKIVLRLTQIWILVLIVGSLQPARPAPVVGLHRDIHWLAFAGAAFLLLLVCRNRRWEIRSLIAVCLLGLSLEYLQHLIYRNAMEWRDVRDDALGVIVAFTLYRLASTRIATFLASRSAPGAGS